MRHPPDGDVSDQESTFERQYKPRRMGCKTRLFISGAALAMCVMQSVKRIGHDLGARLCEMLERLLTHRNSQNNEPLRHHAGSQQPANPEAEQRSADG